MIRRALIAALLVAAGTVPLFAASPANAFSGPQGGLFLPLCLLLNSGSHNGDRLPRHSLQRPLDLLGHDVRLLHFP
jgi:hypothetical protein